MTKAQVLRALVESAEMYQKYYNEAFVIMQYFGYLRRDADISYLQWIQTMKDTNGDYRSMINGFLNSIEYRQRFGPWALTYREEGLTRSANLPALHS